jgi:hypothetical protein
MWTRSRAAIRVLDALGRGEAMALVAEHFRVLSSFENMTPCRLLKCAVTEQARAIL